jgi:uncharacterized protein YndB with AHSA1/START domain
MTDVDDYGMLEKVDGRVRLTFTRRYAQPRDIVWRAITEPEHLRAWFPQEIEGERAAGAKLRFVSNESEDATFDGEMLAFDPPRLMEVRWGTDTLRFELQPDGDGTLLVFTDTFDEIGKAARDGAGWHACLDLLDYEVRGENPPWSSRERWGQVNPGYRRRLGPEASTMGPPDA